MSLKYEQIFTLFYTFSGEDKFHIITTHHIYKPQPKQTIFNI